MRIWSMISGTKLEAKDTCSLKGFYNANGSSI